MSSKYSLGQIRNRAYEGLLCLFSADSGTKESKNQSEKRTIDDCNVKFLTCFCFLGWGGGGGAWRMLRVARYLEMRILRIYSKAETILTAGMSVLQCLLSVDTCMDK